MGEVRLLLMSYKKNYQLYKNKKQHSITAEDSNSLLTLYSQKIQVKNLQKTLAAENLNCTLPFPWDKRHVGSPLGPQFPGHLANTRADYSRCQTSLQKYIQFHVSISDQRNLSQYTQKSHLGIGSFEPPPIKHKPTHANHEAKLRTPQ